MMAPNLDIEVAGDFDRHHQLWGGDEALPDVWYLGDVLLQMSKALDNRNAHARDAHQNHVRLRFLGTAATPSALTPMPPSRQGIVMESSIFQHRYVSRAISLVAVFTAAVAVRLRRLVGNGGRRARTYVETSRGSRVFLLREARILAKCSEPTYLFCRSHCEMATERLLPSATALGASVPIHSTSTSNRPPSAVRTRGKLTA